MRKINHLYIVLFCFALASCTKEMPALYDAADSGINFDFDKATEAVRNIDFATVNLRGKQDTIVDTPLTLTGFRHDKDLKIKIRAEVNPDYQDHILNVELEDYYIIPRDCTGVTIKAKINKPAALQTAFAIDLVIDETGSEVALGMNELGKCTLIAREEYSMPNGWNNFLDYYGAYSAGKHSFIQYTLKSSKFLVWTPDPSVYNLKLIETFRERNRNREEINLSFPIMAANPYTAPQAWDSECEKYYGVFSGALYKLLYDAFDIEMVREELFFSDKTTAVLAKRNKNLVEKSLNAWGNLYATSLWGYTLNGLASPPRLTGFVYEFEQPACWEEYPHHAETKEYTGDGSSFGFIIDYYGEYSAGKMQFMVSCLQETAPLWELFPVQKTINSSTNIYDQKVLAGGEEKLKNLNRSFRKKLDEWNNLHPETPEDFTFPVK